MNAQRALAAAIITASLSAGAQDNPVQRERVLSAPDCAQAGNIIAELASEPLNETYVRVQHIGDPGTGELMGEVAGEVSWDVGSMTGLHVAPSAQRGFRDAPPPVASSAFQLSCGDAGFLINSSQFAHASPLFGEGPSASVARTLDPAPVAFENAQSRFAIQARVAMPTSFSPNLTSGLGVTQLSFFYYARDPASGVLLAHVIGLSDNRVASAGGDGTGNDGYTAFAGSPLSFTDPAGNPVRFVEPGPGSQTMSFGTTWDEPRFFRAEVSYERFKAMLEALKSQSPTMSTEPLDYRLVMFGVLGEIAVGTDHEHDAMLGANVRDLTLSRVKAERRVGRFR